MSDLAASPKKVLVVYYSRTGITKAVATQIAAALDADVEELRDTKKRSGPIGFAAAAKDVVLGKHVPIEPPQLNPADYDLVVIGTPVWANTMATAVDSYLRDFAPVIKAAAVFATTKSSGLDKTCDALAKRIDATTLARAGFREKQVKANQYADVLEPFLDSIRQA